MKTTAYLESFVVSVEFAERTDEPRLLGLHLLEHVLHDGADVAQVLGDARSARLHALVVELVELQQQLALRRRHRHHHRLRLTCLR